MIRAHAVFAALGRFKFNTIIDLAVERLYSTKCNETYLYIKTKKQWGKDGRSSWKKLSQFQINKTKFDSVDYTVVQAYTIKN